jgi:sulfoxide reductase heme-binding subunit YedZ
MERRGLKMVNILLSLPSWQITRVAGLLAYYLLFVGVSLGILYGMPGIKAAWKKRLYGWHAWTQGAGFIVVILHVIILAIDQFSPFTWGQLLVPFSYPVHRFAYGFGSLAFYGLLLVMLTTDFRALISRRTWLILHMTAYPVFFLSLIHGLVGGTDTKNTPIFWGYLFTGAALIAITLLRTGAEGLRQRRANAQIHS